MYNIEVRAGHVHLMFGGFIKKEEMERWVADARIALTKVGSSFGVFVDMRTLNPLPSDAQLVMQEGQKLFKMKGMTRSVVILANPVTTAQFKNIGQQSGIYQWERYIDSSKVLNWEKVGLDWILKSIDPDKS